MRGGPKSIPSRHLPTTNPHARSTSNNQTHCLPTTPPPTLFTVSGVGVSSSETIHFINNISNKMVYENKFTIAHYQFVLKR